MGSFRFPVPSSIAISEAFKDIPPSLKAYMKDGFTVLSKLPADQLTMVSSIALDAVRTPFKVDIDDLAKHLAISKDEAGALLSAVSLLTVFVSGRKDKPEDLVEAAVQANLVPETSRQATLDFSRTLAVQRETLKQDIEKARIAGRVLPSLVDFEVAVDLRFGSSSGRQDLAVPVVVAHIDTDVAHHELWFQMQRADVEKLITDLQKTLKNVSEAEKWGPPRG